MLYVSCVPLQYEEGEMYENFRDFYNDVLPEFSKAGKIVQFKVSIICYYITKTSNNIATIFKPL